MGNLVRYRICFLLEIQRFVCIQQLKEIIVRFNFFQCRYPRQD